MAGERVPIEERWADEEEDEDGFRLLKPGGTPEPTTPEPKEVPAPRTPAPRQPR
jgi:hypothetical protein